MLSFKSVEELMAYMKEEGGRGERFATRFILVKGCQAWDELLLKLQYKVDRVVRLADFCSGLDVFPDLERLRSFLKQETRKCRSLLITPLAESIRLDLESAEALRWLAEWPASNEKVWRIYVPLLAAEGFFEQTLKRVPRFQAGELPEIWSLQGEGEAEIIVAPFAVNFFEGKIIKGIKEYLSQWETSSVRRAWLVTEMAPWLQTITIRGECQVHLYPSSFAYVARNLEGVEVREEWGSSAQWGWLATQLQGKEDLDQLGKRLLNIAAYNADQLFSLWQSLDSNRQWFAWLWSKTQNKADTYLAHVLQRSRHVKDLSYNAVMTIFALPPTVEIVKERKELLKRLGISCMPNDFWERYREKVDCLERIAVLTDLSEAERKELVLCVGELLRTRPRELWWEFLEIVFPELAWYLQPDISGDEFADRYFSAYNCCRLQDRADEELTALITAWASEQLLWNYPARSDLLAAQRVAGAKEVWVDAMGAEWIGLLTQLLAQREQVECKVSIARGNLPTITEANKEWLSEETVERGLDDIAHHYEYQFPDSFLQALQVIEKVAARIIARLAEYPTVVVTTDHGLSRFAATSEVKVDAPEGAEVIPRGHGRYAVLSHGHQAASGEEEASWVVDKGQAVLLTHSRFRCGGFFRGELHGGATPEECLTPVIVLRKTSGELKPHFEVVSSLVKLNANGEGLLTISCNRKVTDVVLRIGGRLLRGQPESGFNWSFSLKNWQAGQYTGKLFYANQLAGEIKFETVKGIIHDDLGL